MLQKAFDSVKGRDVESPKEHDVNNNLVEAIKSFYVNQKVLSRLQVKQQMSSK